MRHQQDLCHNLMWVDGGTSEVNRLMGLGRWRGHIFTTDVIAMAFHFQLRYLNGVAHFWDFGVKKIFLSIGIRKNVGFFLLWPTYW